MQLRKSYPIATASIALRFLDSLLGHYRQASATKSVNNSSGYEVETLNQLKFTTLQKVAGKVANGRLRLIGCFAC